MYEDEITIDIDRLRADMCAERVDDYLCGGFGDSLMEASDIECASPEELVRMAMQQGINLYNYQVF